ncbi:MAG: hypothetical protein FRX48_02712 [Lasallia pustulata]|uniref:Uncharacterized protein n=1 Tax=Lasallia pustulata TaxID=136370 RepID=A0A5M8PV89_9LECA|nr:MAG: hypothetical protein FRX48_02712 [Lasallia pustulata]
MDDAVLPLEKEYCPPIDPALFSAILSDYDLSDPPRIDEVRSVLNALKESADAEGTADFDPSGSSGLLYATGNHESPDRARSWHGEEAARSEETDSTGLSQHIEMLGIEPFPEPETEERERKHGEDYDKGLDQLSPWEKEDLLKEMFPTMKAFDISYSLKKNKYNFGRTVEELLNHVFFEEEQEANGDGHVVAKGIDAFMDGADGTRGRKAKAKRRKQTNLRRTSSNPAPLAHNPTSSSSSSPQKLSSKWELAKQDVEFITQRTYLSPQTVSSQYHQSGASLAATISALVNAF